jgi:uncharacterized membrane protein
MANLVVLAFDDEEGADRTLSTLAEAQQEGLISIADAAVVRRNADGKPKVRQAANLVGAGAAGGAFWGMLIGLLFFMPWLGMGIGAITGALGGKFKDYGINDDFIKRVGDEIQPGSSALFLLAHSATIDKLQERLSAERFRLLHTSLSNEQEQALREAFGA